MSDHCATRSASPLTILCRPCALLDHSGPALPLFLLGHARSRSEWHSRASASSLPFGRLAAPFVCSERRNQYRGTLDGQRWFQPVLKLASCLFPSHSDSSTDIRRFLSAFRKPCRLVRGLFRMRCDAMVAPENEKGTEFECNEMLLIVCLFTEDLLALLSIWQFLR